VIEAGTRLGDTDIARLLTRLAAETGGSHVVSEEARQLESAAMWSALNGRNQYVIEFAPELKGDGSLHALEVRVSWGAGIPALRVRARRYYWDAP
jgi:hypothetical protein